MSKIKFFFQTQLFSTKYIVLQVLLLLLQIHSSVYALAQTLDPVHGCLILRPARNYEFGQVAKLLIHHLLFQSCQGNMSFV